MNRAQTRIVAGWTALAAVLVPVAILAAGQPLWGPVAAIALLALIFPGAPIAALMMERRA